MISTLKQMIDLWLSLHGEIIIFAGTTC